MAERYFEIRNFRNIGITKSEKIIINTGLEPENLGKLIVVVGENNAGKTNVLRAIATFAKNNIDENDVPEFALNTSPYLCFGIKDQNLEYRVSTTLNGKYQEETITQGAKVFKEKYGYNIVPKIYAYREVRYTNDDLKNSDSKFYETFNPLIDLKTISDQFNKLFLKKKDEYSFHYINGKLEIHYLDRKMNLDLQSTSFSWFFNFFFSFVMFNKMKIGDILLIDEPATHLHVKGMIELRAYLKEIAKKFGITIIISTNMPFLIDCDYLDELRIVKRMGFESVIVNNFTLVNGIDSLDLILNALTIGRHIIVAPQTKVVFVEGITDYNYLTAFKMLFNIKDILFLPIQGVSHKSLGKDLMQIQQNPILLTDNDHAGVLAKSSALKDKVKAVCLGDIDPRFVAIESLFDYLDLYEHNLNIKSFAISSNFKHNIASYKLSKFTKDNFRKVLNYLKKC